MGDVVEITCPWCFESCDLFVEIENHGRWIEDCPVCCRPWQLNVHWDGERAIVHVERS